MDFVKALTFPFEDEEWIKKIGIGVGISIGGILLGFLLLIPTIIAGLLFAGWQFEIIKRVKNNDPTPLPDWDFGAMIAKGGTLVGALLVYQIPTILFACAAAGVFALPLLGAGNEDVFAALGAGASIISICCSCFIFIYVIVAGLVYMAGLIRFTDNEQFSTFMQFGDNISLFRENIGDFGMAILYMFGGNFIASIASSLTAGIGSIFLQVFSSYFGGHVLGQLAAKLAGTSSADAAPAV